MNLLFLGNQYNNSHDFSALNKQLVTNETTIKTRETVYESPVDEQTN